jgi:hypothetical protein
MHTEILTQRYDGEKTVPKSSSASKETYVHPCNVFLAKKIFQRQNKFWLKNDAK